MKNLFYFLIFIANISIFIVANAATIDTTPPTTTTTKPTTTKAATAASKAPSDPKDSAWCSFNKTKAAVNYKYPTPNANTTKAFLDSQNLKMKINSGTIIAIGSTGGTDNRSSYCMC